MKIGNSPPEQLKLEKKRFKQRMRHKPVLAKRIKSREERQLSEKSEKKVNFEELRE